MSIANYLWRITLGTLLDKITWPFDHMILQGHMTNENHYISTATVPMATKPVNVITYLEDSFP